MGIFDGLKNVQEDLIEKLYKEYGDYKIFEGVDSEIVKSILSKSQEATFGEGYSIIIEGDEQDGKAYLIKDGEVSITRGGQEVAKLKHGDIFGEYGIISEDLRTATVKVTKEVRCLILNKNNLLALAEYNNTLNETLTKRSYED